MVVIADSVGYVDALSNISDDMGIQGDTTLIEWALRKDHEGNRKKAYRKQPSVRLRRARSKRDDWNKGLKASKKARSGGIDYETGIGINDPTMAGIDLPSSPNSGIGTSLYMDIAGKKTRQKKACSCGAGGLHYSSNYKQCARNKNSK